MQLPFTPAPKAPPVDPEILRQRRQELAKRLVEINAKKREEKVNSLNCDIQKKPLNLITLALTKIDDINRMIPITGYFYFVIFSKWTLNGDHIKRLMSLPVITASDFHKSLTLLRLYFSFFQLQEDEALLKTLMTAKSLYEQGYDEKVKKNTFQMYSTKHQD